MVSILQQIKNYKLNLWWVLKLDVGMRFPPEYLLFHVSNNIMDKNYLRLDPVIGYSIFDIIDLSFTSKLDTTTEAIVFLSHKEF